MLLMWLTNWQSLNIAFQVYFLVDVSGHLGGRILWETGLFEVLQVPLWTNQAQGDQVPNMARAHDNYADF